MKLYVCMAVSLTAIAAAREMPSLTLTNAKPSQGLTWQKIKKMNINKAKKEINKQKARLLNKGNAVNKALKSQGFDFKPNQIAKTGDDVLKGLASDGINKYEASKVNIAAKGKALSAKVSARAAEFEARKAELNAFRAKHGSTKLEDVRKENQAKVQDKIDTIKDKDLKKLTNSLWGSLTAGLETQVKKIVPAKTTYEGAAKLVGEQALNILKGLPVLKDTQKRFNKLQKAVTYQCNRFYMGKKKCLKAIEDAEKYANKVSSKAGGDKALKWVQDQQAKFDLSL